MTVERRLPRLNRKVKALLVRAAKTFLQAFLAVVTAAGANVIPNISTLKTAAVAGLAALLSFIQNSLTDAESGMSR